MIDIEVYYITMPKVISDEEKIEVTEKLNNGSYYFNNTEKLIMSKKTDRVMYSFSILQKTQLTKNNFKIR